MESIKGSKLLDHLTDEYPDIDWLVATGFDDALEGYCSTSNRLIYSIPKCVDVLIDHGMTYEEAIEFFHFNVEGAYVGEMTPIWMAGI